MVNVYRNWRQPTITEMVFVVVDRRCGRLTAVVGRAALTQRRRSSIGQIFLHVRLNVDSSAVCGWTHARWRPRLYHHATASTMHPTHGYTYLPFTSLPSHFTEIEGRGNQFESRLVMTIFYSPTLVAQQKERKVMLCLPFVQTTERFS